MTQNDFLGPLFNLPPFVVAAVTFFWGFGSLVLYGFKTKSVKSVVLKSPGMMIGDFFIIPGITFLVTYFYQTVKNPLPATASSWWPLATALIALLMAIVSGIRFKLVNRWILPHGLFYWFMVYILLTFFSKGLYQLVFGEGTKALWFVWGLVLVGILTHLALGVIKPKKFPSLN